MNKIILILALFIILSNANTTCVFGFDNMQTQSLSVGDPELKEKEKNETVQSFSYEKFPEIKKEKEKTNTEPEQNIQLTNPYYNYPYYGYPYNYGVYTRTIGPYYRTGIYSGFGYNYKGFGYNYSVGSKKPVYINPPVPQPPPPQNIRPNYGQSGGTHKPGGHHHGHKRH